MKKVKHDRDASDLLGMTADDNQICVDNVDEQDSIHGLD